MDMRCVRTEKSEKRDMAEHRDYNQTSVKAQNPRKVKLR